MPRPARRHPVSTRRGTEVSNFLKEVTVTSESVTTLSSAQATGDAVRVINSNSEILISVSYEEFALMLRWALAQAKKWESQQEDDLSE